jgi:DNA-binding IclR family transcriptional regulator
VKTLSMADGGAGREVPIQAVRQPALASVGVISKVLRILEVLQNSPGGLGLKAICDETGINKSTAHRFLRHLERESYLLRREAGAYLIGPRLTQMSACATRSATLQVAARPILADLWRSTQETVNLGVLDQGTLLYVDVMESPHEFRLVSRIGTRRSLHVAALGKALTTFLPAGEYERVLNGIVFQRVTPRTIANITELRAELDKVRRQGYAVDNEEALLGCRCVSAPILNNEGVAIGAVSVAGPVTRMSLVQVPGLAKLVRAAANAVSTVMGFSPRKRTPGNPKTSQKSASASLPPSSTKPVSFH